MLFIYLEELEAQARFFKKGFVCYVNSDDDLCFVLPDEVQKF